MYAAGYLAASLASTLKFPVTSQNCNNQNVTKHPKFPWDGWKNYQIIQDHCSTVLLQGPDTVSLRKKMSYNGTLELLEWRKKFPGGFGSRTRCSHISPYSKNPLGPRDNKTESEGKLPAQGQKVTIQSCLSNPCPLYNPLPLLHTTRAKVLEYTYCVLSGTSIEVVRPT